MRGRTRARVYALQMLYQLDVRSVEPVALMHEFWRERVCPDEVQAFANRLVSGTMEHRQELDAAITRSADNWELHRMAVIDRNILRLGAFELLHLQDVPPKVCINEAIELAKRFGDSDSGKFINGVLDAIHKTHERAAG